MIAAHDVAAYILEKCGQMTAMKLQKLAYYSHAWHLVWDEKPLFGERIEAWANGPVIREVYNQHRCEFIVSTWPAGNAAKLSTSERTTIDAVIGYYGEMSAHQLSELTHSEPPWQLARTGLPPGSRSSVQITDDAMAEYYDSMTFQPN